MYWEDALMESVHILKSSEIMVSSFPLLREAGE